MHEKSIKLIYFSMGGSGVKEINLGWRNAVLIGGTFIIFLGLVIASVLALFTDFYKDIRIQNLADANASLHSQLDDMGQQIDRITSRIHDLEQTDNEMRMFVDLDAIGNDTRNVGVGGFTREIDYAATTIPFSGNLQAQDLRDLLAECERRVSLLQASRVEIEKKYEDDQYIWNHIPSILPVQGGRIGDRFGMRKDPITGEWKSHEGVDFPARRGEPVFAVADGKVLIVHKKYKPNKSYGKEIIIDHGNGLRTRYAHLSKILVNSGQTISRWDVIGRVGDTGRTTGPHLHYEVLQNNRAIDPSDYFLDQ